MDKKKAPNGSEEGIMKAITVFLPERLKEMIFRESQQKGYTMKNLIIFIVQSHFENTAQR